MLQTEKKFLRQERILQVLDSLGYATRKQLQVICDLGGDRNASRILRRMEVEKTIQSTRMEYKVYSLTHRGKETIGSTKDLRSGHIHHTLMRNDLYIMLGMPDDWKTEFEIRYKGQQERMVCDAVFKHKGEWHFVEVDNKQTMRNNYDKVKAYAVLKRDIFTQFKHVPTVIFYTVSDNRKQKIEECMERCGVKGKVYT